MRYTSRLADAGAAPSVVSAGDAYDNALAESIIDLYRTEVIHRPGPWKRFEGVEYATLEWVAWLDTQRVLEPLGYVSPAEFEEQHYRTQAAPAERLVLDSPSLLRTRGGSARGCALGVDGLGRGSPRCVGWTMCDTLNVDRVTPAPRMAREANGAPPHRAQHASP